MRTLEGEWLEVERAAVAPLVRGVPRRGNDFVPWFDALRNGGPAQGDPLFDWLAERATLDELRWFMRQELASEAGLDDLRALTRLRMPPRPELELGGSTGSARRWASRVKGPGRSGRPWPCPISCSDSAPTVASPGMRWARSGWWS